MPGALPTRERNGPLLSLATRLGLYAMLAGLVLASFTVSPAQRAPTTAAPSADELIAAPAADEPTAARIVPLSRGLIRWPREMDDVDLTVSESLTPEPSAWPAAETVPVPLPETAVEPEGEATPDPTPVPTAAPRPRPVAPAVAVVTNLTTARAEVHMLELMNASRARAGLLPLLMDVGVANTARAHSAAEAQVRYVYHDGPDGTARSRDVPACGSGWYGENTGKIWNDNVDALHIEFMAEPWEPINHRTNIMDPAFRRVGVGAVIGPDAMYMTMVFCR